MVPPLKQYFNSRALSGLALFQHDREQGCRYVGGPFGGGLSEDPFDGVPWNNTWAPWFIYPFHNKLLSVTSYLVSEVIFDICYNVLFVRGADHNLVVGDAVMDDPYERLPSYLDTLPDPPGDFHLPRDCLEDQDDKTMLLDSNVLNTQCNQHWFLSSIFEN